MGKLIHLVHQSLDGFIEGPQGEFDWPAMGPQLSAYSQDLTPEGTLFLYGRKVWDLMAGFWPNAEQYSDDPHDLAFAPVWRKAPKVVVSRTLGTADHNTRVISVNAAEEIAALKAAGHDLVLFGGSELAAHLTERRVIDEYHVVVHPVVLGGGRPTFPPSLPRTELTLLETRTFDGRSVLLRHGLNS
ncbi:MULTISPECIES: dihydrofolate reductase family protein [Streptomyces]|uniref:Dihydrofolate reductase family protein n=1 Tax=Streptomyces solicathayae TaxID=3081768 RepID=A0ABZ0LP08_9ACTN|nr:dihydrofolate reductase family protein [Streptomyces sp. HUAS YS2]WOX20961.1 dihydrofolate reductase family protein [Streptomyces sp. HUAS YS2]